LVTEGQGEDNAKPVETSPATVNVANRILDITTQEQFTVPKALQKFTKRIFENDVILNLAAFSKFEYFNLGAALFMNYAVVWFGFGYDEHATPIPGGDTFSNYMAMKENMKKAHSMPQMISHKDNENNDLECTGGQASHNSSFSFQSNSTRTKMKAKQASRTSRRSSKQPLTTDSTTGTSGAHEKKKKSKQKVHFL